jgi:hypothetical protein
MISILIKAGHLAAATCRGVALYLSLALTSALAATRAAAGAQEAMRVPIVHIEEEWARGAVTPQNTILMFI